MLRNTVKSGLYDILLFILQFKSQAIRYLLPNISFIKSATERLVFSNASVELLYRAYNSPLFSLLSFLFNLLDDSQENFTENQRSFRTAFPCCTHCYGYY